MQQPLLLQPSMATQHTILSLVAVKEIQNLLPQTGKLPLVFQPAQISPQQTLIRKHQALATLFNQFQMAAGLRPVTASP